MSDYNIEFPIMLSLEEAYQGAQREVVFPRTDAVCDTCSGGGYSGQVPCSACAGSGYTSLPHRLTVPIPIGVNDQVRLRVRGQGRWDPDARTWADLHLICYLRSHARFQRKATDLTLEVPVLTPLPEQVTVNTLAGPVAVQTAGARPGSTIRLASYGLHGRIGGGSPGNLDLCLVAADGAATQEEFRAAVGDAKRAAAGGQAQEVVALLGAPRMASHLAAPEHALLAVAYARAGDAGMARSHLCAAIRKDPGNPVHTLQMGQFAISRAWNLTAAVATGVFLRHAPSHPQARAARSRALGALFSDAESQSTRPETAEAIRAAQSAAERRAYGDAYDCLLPHADLPEAYGLALGMLLLHAADGEEVRLLSIANQLGRPPAGWPDTPAATSFAASHGLYLELWCGLRGHLALARHHEAAGGDSGRAMASGHARAALRRADSTVMPDVDRSAYDPVLQDQIMADRDLLAPRREGTTNYSVEGLIAGARARFEMRLTADLQAGWRDAVAAAQYLELALCERPDDKEILADLEQAVDYVGGVGSAMIGRIDLDQAEFYAASRDAVLNNIIPNSPAAMLQVDGEGRSSLRTACATALLALKQSTRSLLRGEFLVSLVPGHHVLTSYRLLIEDDRFPHPHLLPLCEIDRYTTRPNGISGACVVIGVGGGRQLSLDNQPRGTFPADDLMQYLIACRMWEWLSEAEVQALSRGVPAQPAQSVAPQLAPGPATRRPTQLLTGESSANACFGCGSIPRPTDRFCRKCGMEVPPPSAPQTPGGS